MLTGKHLRQYLAYTVHGRKPMRQAENAAPRKTTPMPRNPLPHGPLRDEAYKAWIRQQPSLVSGKTPCDAAHTGSDGGMGQKASDDTCVPLTRAEHREYHRIGKAAFEKRYRLNFADACNRLNAAWRRAA